MDKIRALRYFKYVAELKSFSLAARELDVPSSSISRRIKDLESALGVQLLKRSTRRVSMTELGSLYYEMICPALQTINEADELISQRVGAMEGRLRISAPVSFGEKILSPILHKFRRAYPAILLDVNYSEKLLDFDRDSVDIAIRANRVPDARVVAKPLCQSSMTLVLAPALLEKLQQQLAKKIFTADDFSQCPVFQYRSVHGLISWWASKDQHWQELEINPVSISNNGHSILVECLAGDGLAMFPHWWVEAHLASGALVEFPVDTQIAMQKSTQLQMFILYRQAKYQIPKIKLCVDFITEHLGDKE